MKHTKVYSITFLLFFLLSQTASGQKLYNIEIVFSGTDGKNVNIGTHVYQGFRMIPLKKDTTNLISEKIALSARYPIIEISYFSPKHAPAIHRFFLKNQQCKLQVHYDKETDIVHVIQTSGVTSFEEAGLHKYKTFAKTELAALEAFARSYNYDIPTADPVVEKNYTQYAEAIKDKGVQFVKQNPHLLYSTYLFTYEIIGDPRYPKDEILEIFNNILKQNTISSEEEKLILNKLQGSILALYTQAPLQNKVFTDLRGTEYSISSFNNKLVLINIWSTGCGPCLEEIPRLKELYEKYNTSLEIISFSTEDDAQYVRNFINAKGIHWINVINQPEITYAFNSDKGIPQFFLLNEKGMIIYSRSANADPTLDQLEKILARYVESRNPTNNK